MLSFLTLKSREASCLLSSCVDVLDLVSAAATSVCDSQVLSKATNTGCIKPVEW